MKARLHPSWWYPLCGLFCGLITTFLCIVLWQANLTLCSARKATERIPETIDALDETIVTIHETMAQFRGTATQLNETMGAQTAQLQASTKELQKTEHAFRAMVDDTNKSLNQPGAGLLPRLSGAVAKADDVLVAAHGTLGKATQELSALEPGTKSFNGAMDNANVASFSMASSAQHLDTATNEAAQTLLTVHKGVEYEYQQITKPVSKVKAAALFAARFVGRLFGL